MNKNTEKSNRKLESIKRIQRHSLEMKNVCEFKYASDEFDRTKQSGVSEFEDRSTEIIQTEIYKGKVMKVKNRALRHVEHSGLKTV